MNHLNDQFWMTAALSLARAAGLAGEVPVGAVLTKNNRIVATGVNRRESLHDPSEHAELRAIRKAAHLLGSWRLSHCELYVTLEPCVMCAGAISQARIGRVIYSVRDQKAGACGSLFSIHNDPRLNHSFPVTEGIKLKESQKVLRDFFAAKRD